MNLSNKSKALEEAAKAILEEGYGATRGSNWKAVRNGSSGIDTMIDTAKTTKSKNNFYIFNNKGQIYHTAPTLDKAKKHAVDYKKHPNEMGNPTILDLSKGKIVESIELDEAKLKGTVKTQAAKMFEGLANDVEYLKDAMNHSTYKDAIKDWEANADGKDLIKAIGKILQTQYFGK